MKTILSLLSNLHSLLYEHFPSYPKTCSHHVDLGVWCVTWFFNRFSTSPEYYADLSPVARVATAQWSFSFSLFIQALFSDLRSFCFSATFWIPAASLRDYSYSGDLSTPSFIIVFRQICLLSQCPLLFGYEYGDVGVVWRWEGVKLWCLRVVMWWCVVVVVLAMHGGGGCDVWCGGCRWVVRLECRRWRGGQWWW